MLGHNESPDAWLAKLQPELVGGTLMFVHVRNAAGGVPLDRTVRSIASLVDDAGITHVVTEADARRLGLEGTFPCRRLELGVDTPIEGVGFLAPILTAFAAAGISVNPFAGLHRDTLFVPADRANDALMVLGRLRSEAAHRIENG